MRTISNNTISATVSDSVYNESTATLFINGLTGAEVAPIQISGDNVNFVDYYEGGSLVQLSATVTSKSLAYPGYYRVSVPDTSAIASVSVVKPEWKNIIDVTWEPAKLGADLLLWLDAKSPATIVQVSSKISQWNDRSGNARHVTQTNAALRPTYSSSTYGLCVSYAAGNALDISADAIEVLSPETFVIVGLCNFGTPEVAYRWVYYNGYYSNTEGTGQQIQGYSDDKILMYDAYDSNANKYSGGEQLNINQDSVFSAYHNGTAFVQRQSGAQYRTDDTSGTYNPAGANINSIGSTNFDGKIYSLAIANYTSAADVERLEGYICHRYGAQALLNAAHPYRNVAP